MIRFVISFCTIVKLFCLSVYNAGLWIRIDLMRIRIQQFSLLRIWIRIQFRSQGFDDLNLKKIHSCKTFSIF